MSTLTIRLREARARPEFVRGELAAGRDPRVSLRPVVEARLTDTGTERTVREWGQAYLASLLGYPEPAYAHVALVLNADGARLAKRDGAVTLAEIGVPRAFAQIAESLGWPASDMDELLERFDPAQLPHHPWVYEP